MTVGPGRALGLDLGAKRIGAAICDSDRTVATPLEVIPGADRAAAYRRIADLIEEWEVVVVVVGLPKMLDGRHGKSAKLALKEVGTLGATLSVPIMTYDERLSTVTASRSLIEQNVRGQQRKDVVDMVAAQVILQGWIDQERM